MLQSISDRAQGWLTWIIFGLLIIPFALWGINHYFEGGSSTPAADVNGQKIDSQEFQWTYQQQRQRMQQMFGSSFDFSKINEEQFKQQTLDQLIEQALLEQVGARSGMRISDRIVASTINSMEEFQTDGKFAQDRYEQQLRAVGFTPIGYEERLRKDMLSTQLRKGISDSAFTTKQEMERIARLNGQKRDVGYFVLSVEAVKPSVQITDEEVETYYSDSKNRYMTQELVKVSYIDLSLDELSKRVTVDDGALRGYYEGHISSYATPEQRSANHILVQVEKGADQKQEQAAREKADEYLKRIKQGESIEQIAKAHSDDVGSKAEGGQTGLFSKGMMDPTFEAAAFAMKPGEVSDPIRSDFGFHVIRLNEVKAGTTKSFEEVKSEIESAYRKEQAEKMYFDSVERLANSAFENPDSLDPASNDLGVPIKESEFFTRVGDSDLTRNPKVLEAAFSAQVLDEGKNSEPLELEANRTLVLRLKEHKPAEQKKLDDVKKEIRESLLSERARGLVAERAGKLLERLKAGEDRTKLVEQEKLKWEEAKGVDQQAGNVNRAILRTAFQLGRPTGSVPLFGSTQVPGVGDVAVIAVNNVQDGDPASQDEKSKTQVRDQLLRTAGTGEWRDFVAELRKKATVQTFKDKL